MKKIINGKLYNTETAREVGWREYSNPGDFHYIFETLYCKKTGEYFLHGVGGALTQYAETIGQNQWRGGEHIEPMNLASAREWAEQYLSADAYEAEFGEVTEDDSRTTLTLSIATSTAEKIRRTAQEKGITMSALIDSLFDGSK